MIRTVILRGALAGALLGTSGMSVTGLPVLAATRAAAQITPAQAAPFVGDWTLAMQGPDGPATFRLSIKAEKDKVTGEIASEKMLPQDIEDVSLEDKSLVLRYSFTYEGNPVATVVGLTPSDGGRMAAQIDFAGGAYVMTGTATKKDQRDPKADAAPPPGFTALFNGRDLSGWRGRPGGGGVFSPYVEAKFTPDEREAKQREWNADRDLHWRVDTGKAEIVSDGKGVHLATEKPYGDFEFRVDWLLTQPGGDSGIYLRSYPQVQIWDPSDPRGQKNGADKGSGGLWNNNPDNPGRWPLVQADNPIGQWNTMTIKMVGTRVWVTLNGKPTVVGQVLDNFFDRTQPVLPTGSIELQTHGSEVRFRNIYVREIGAEEGKALLATVGAAAR